MHRKYKLVYIAIAALVAAFGYAVTTNSAKSEDAKSNADDVQAIKQAAGAYSTAFEKGNIDELLSHWSPDAEYIDESGKMTQGHEAIAAMIRKNLENMKGYKLKLEGKGLRFVTADVAMVDGRATLVSPEGKEDVTPFAAVWVKSGGKWRVRSLRDLGDEEAKAPATATDHLKLLDPLLGDWTCDQKGKNVQVHCGWTLNKSFVLVQYTVKTGNEETTTMQQFGWDPVNQQIHSWYFDSTGGYGEATCTQGGDGIVSEASGVLPDGRVGTAINRLHMIDDKSFVYQSRNRAVDGRPLADIDMNFVRSAGKE
jgi:uncharacterized protein (TIGR02246 family)